MANPRFKGRRLYLLWRGHCRISGQRSAFRGRWRIGALNSIYHNIKVKVKVTQLCPTLCDPMDCSPPDSSVLGILQASILEWVAIPFSWGSSQPRDQTKVSCITGRFFFFFFCSGFCHTLKWNSHGFTCVPHPDPASHLPLHLLPLGFPSGRALVSCIQPGLVICFTLDNIHVSMLFSWNIPPSPSPTESKRLFYKSVFFFSVLHIGLSLTSF